MKIFKFTKEKKDPDIYPKVLVNFNNVDYVVKIDDDSTRIFFKSGKTLLMHEPFDSVSKKILRVAKYIE